MSLLSFGDKIESLKKKSSDAIGVFKKTVSDLSLANQEIDKEVSDRENKIADITSEINVLTTVKTQNVKYIDEINEFLNID